MVEYYTIQWQENSVSMLDQRLLPEKVEYLAYTDYHDLANAIQEMVIRGAPAIGAAAAYGIALAASQSRAKETNLLIEDILSAAEVIKASRPTAVNLFWAVERMLSIAYANKEGSVDSLRKILLNEAHKIAEEDGLRNRQIGQNALPLVPDHAKIIHHCNTGALATVEYGTALGVIRAAHEAGKTIHVYVDETRPRLQGSRLTSWELIQLGIPHTIIADGASGYVMRTIGVDLCLVGCDRIAANGDTANKIGTYNLSLVAAAHHVPFYVVGPISTIDLSTKSGRDIPIEERPAEEITQIGKYRIAPETARAANFAFDVTPAEYITAIITEKGIAYPPYEESLPRLVNG